MNRRLVALVAVVTTSALWVGAACAQPEPPIVTRAEDCLKARVDRVVADDPDLQSAASFLISYACASEVSGAQTYETNLLEAAQINGMVKNMGTVFSPPRGGPQEGVAPAASPALDFTVTVDPETGDLVIPPNAPPGPLGQMLTTMMPQSMKQAATLLAGGAAPTRLRAMAGELVLASYERQHKPRIAERAEASRTAHKEPLPPARFFGNPCPMGLATFDTDGRCAWANPREPIYVAYHDEEWGVPEYDARALWEKLVLDGFQAGLAWITILKKREAFRAAFANFDPEVVARYGNEDRARLMADAGIVRSNAKIDAAISGAQIWLGMRERGEDFSGWLWSFVGGAPIQNTWSGIGQVPAQTPEAVAMAKALKAKGFKFCGPVIVYAFMQAVGMVNDHVTSCPRHAEVARLARPAPGRG